MIAILSLYLESILVTLLFILIISLIWFLYRVLRKKDQTAAERRRFLYDLVLIDIISTPIWAFAMMCVILVWRA